MDYKIFRNYVIKHIKDEIRNEVPKRNEDVILTVNNLINISRLLYEESQYYYLNKHDHDSLNKHDHDSLNKHDHDSLNKDESYTKNLKDKDESYTKNLKDKDESYTKNLKDKYDLSVMILESDLWDWKNLHTYPGFDWHILLYIPEKLNKNDIHTYSKLNWTFVMNYRNLTFWDWDKLSSRSDSFKMYKKCKKLPWRMLSMARVFDTDLDFWEYIFKNSKELPKNLYKSLSLNVNFPFKFLCKYPQTFNLWDWKEISNLPSLNISFVKDNTNFPWDWDIISYRF